ncbi:hypothetical protein Hanom_Chr07g00598071 [Helianthus anomalus]
MSRLESHGGKVDQLYPTPQQVDRCQLFYQSRFAPFVKLMDGLTKGTKTIPWFQRKYQFQQISRPIHIQKFE